MANAEFELDNVKIAVEEQSGYSPVKIDRIVGSNNEYFLKANISSCGPADLAYLLSE